VETEEEALEKIQQLKKKYYDATHNCWAYVIRGGAMRFSDDGEPGGTAGNPMMQVLQREGLNNVVCIVTRYFGGVLLGAGGLVRAYSSSAAECLDKADIRVLLTCAEYAIFVAYTGVDSVQKYISTHTCSLLSIDYGEKVCFKIAVKKTEEDSFIQGLVDYMQGRVQTERGKEYYSAFTE
jgi:uncharacterized YigZ family protein